MSTPIVSVCIVTFNHERYIHDCIMSVVAQSNDVSLEILVGDDQSEDRTSEIVQSLVREYPHLIRYYLHKERLGCGSKNYQTLITRSRGEFIAHLDGDDFWLSGKLLAQIHFLKQHTDCPAVYSNALAIQDNGEAIGLFNNPQPTFFDINELLRRGNFLNNSSMCYRSSLRDKILSMQAPLIDYRIHLQFARCGAVGYLNQAMVVYRSNSSSSIIVHENDNVRSLYWEALLDVPIDSVNIRALAQCMSEFVRSIFFRSIRVKKMSLLQQWLPVVFKAAPVGKTKMIFLILSAIVRVAFQEGLSMICSKLSGNHLKILYRR